MSQVGRNAPCPCGSGRKYKRCCLKAKSQRREGGAYSSEDRARGFALLQRHLERPRWRAFMRQELLEIVEGRQAVFEVPTLDEYTVNSLADAIIDWSCFDGEGDAGVTPVADLLAHQTVPLGAGRFLRAMAASNLRPLEVIGVRPEQTITFKDLADGTETTVRERTASRTVMPGQIVFARLVAGTTDLPEIERGMLPVPALGRAETVAACDRWRTDRGTLVERSRELGLELIDIWIDGTLGRWMPSVTVGDGEALMFVKSSFEIREPDRIATVLDGLDELSSTGPEHWRLAPDGGAPAFIRIDGARLVLEAVSAEAGARARALIEATLGSAISHRSTTHQHPAQAMAESTDRPTPAPSIPPEIERRIITEQMHRHYVGWLDDELPALDGATPRNAAASVTLRPKLESLLRGLDHLYLKALEDRPVGAYDPSWLWDELGVRRHGYRPPGVLGLMGHEAVAEHVDGFGRVVEAMATRRRQEPGFDASTVITDDYVAADVGAMSLIRTMAKQVAGDGGTRDVAQGSTSRVRAYLGCAANYALHSKKTFHVDESLAFMLSRTSLNVGGDQVELPFPSCALVFRDRPTLGLMERVLATDDTRDDRGAFLQTLTVYVHRLPTRAGAGLGVGIVCDAENGRLPYLLVRDLQYGPDDAIETVLASHCDDIRPLDSGLAGAPLRDVLRVVMNAMLYATSTREDWQPRRRTTESPAADALEVIDLPGHLDLDTVRSYRRLEMSPSGGALMDRFLVRGRWRRANPNWKDQRPRWIKPRWNGPSVAAVVEG